ncbi:MAG: MarR family transcriptional regulator [Gracilibacteraceae bacterium]|jgi:DNA-binding MarR family transcriptional regulator|nr:MarR family transcriptional regulator [Gracilibacteraceae bacterium]
MKESIAALNELLTDFYLNILRLEETTLRGNPRIALSLHDVLLIHAVSGGGDEGLAVGALAEKLNVSRPSATVAVSKLEKKGFVRKSAHPTDGRIVCVHLTKEGEKIDAYLMYFQRYLVAEMNQALTPEESDCLVRAVRKMNEVFVRNIGN